MSQRLAIGALLYLAVFPLSAEARIEPTFWEEYSAWHATHVVVVDAKGAVLESWKGDLKPGDVLALDALKVPKDEKIYFREKKKKDDPERVTGARTVLFLTRKGDAWEPASLFGGMKVAVAWIETGGLFAFRDKYRDCRLVPLDLTEERLKRVVARADAVKKEMDAVAREADLEKRAWGVVRFVDSEIDGPYWDAFEILGGCGKAALPVCRRLLTEPKYALGNPKSRAMTQSKLIEAMAKAGGKDARADLIALLEDEQRYWKRTAPTQKAWWGQQPMTGHYSRLHTALHELAKIGITRDQEDLVASVRDLWRTHPRLGANGDFSQIADSADAVLRTIE